MATYDWLIGFGLTFGLGIGFAFMLDDLNMRTFIIYSTIFCTFVVWIGFLELWVLVLLMICVLVIVFIEMRGVRRI